MSHPPALRHNTTVCGGPGDRRAGSRRAQRTAAERGGCRSPLQWVCGPIFLSNGAASERPSSVTCVDHFLGSSVVLVLRAIMLPISAAARVSVVIGCEDCFPRTYRMFLRRIWTALVCDHDDVVRDYSQGHPPHRGASGSLSMVLCLC